MSNLLSIEVIESRTAGTNGPFEFSVIVSDSYGAAYDKGFESMEALMESHPTRRDLLNWVEKQVEFADAISCKGTVIFMDSVTGIDFAGYPDDDSITAILGRDSFESSSQDSRPIAGDPRLFIEELGYDVREDSQQPGHWIWTAPTDSCESSFHTAKEALDSAWDDAVGQTISIQELSKEQWGSMSFKLQKVAVLRALSEAGDEVQDIVDDVLARSKEYGFKPDENTVRDAVDESCKLLEIELSENQIIEACERITSTE